MRELVAPFGLGIIGAIRPSVRIASSSAETSGFVQAFKGFVDFGDGLVAIRGRQFLHLSSCLPPQDVPGIQPEAFRSRQLVIKGASSLALAFAASSALPSGQPVLVAVSSTS